MTTLSAEAACWQLGPLHYDANQRRLTAPGQQLDLEPRQHQLLLCLLGAPGQVVSRDTLIAQVWQGRIVSDSAINRAVSVLRKALGSLDTDNNYVETVPKLGYRLVAAVAPAEPLPLASSQLLPQRQKAPNTLRYRGLALLLLLSVLVITLFFALSDRAALVAEPQLTAGYVVPHTGFDGIESMISADSSGTRLLYLRRTGIGHQQVWLHELNNNRHTALTPDSEDSPAAAISPDGSQFVYARFTDGHCQLMLQQLHSAIAKVLQPCPADNLPLFSWREDGKTLYFRQRSDKTHPYQLYQLDLASGVSRQLTLLPADYTGQGDIALAAAADKIAVLRYISADETDLLLLESDSGQLLSQRQLKIKAALLSWYGPDRLLISAGNVLYQYHLPTAQLSPLYQAAEPLTSFVKVQQQLYFSSSGVNAGIWQSDADGNLNPRILSSRLDLMPRLSHQTNQLAFLSNRLGHHQLWLQQADGTERLLTELPGQPGFVRLEWSADDSKLLFAKNDAVYSVEVASGELQRLLPNEYKVGVVNAGPLGNQLIYSRWQDNDWQLWLYDISQNSHQQLTSQGGYSGRIWLGRLYFSKYHHDGLWVKAPDSQHEQLLIAEFDKINWLNWHIAADKLYYYQPELGIFGFDLQQQQAALHLAEPSRFVRHFQVSPKGTLFVRYGSLQGDIYRLPLSLSEPAQP